MPTKITTKQVSTEVESDLYVLITQTENGVPVLRRMHGSVLFDALGVNGLKYENNQLVLQCNGVDVGAPVIITGGGGQGWTPEQINLLDALFDHISYTDPQGGVIADALIASLRGEEPEEYIVEQDGDTLIISKAPAEQDDDALIIS